MRLFVVEKWHLPPSVNTPLYRRQYPLRSRLRVCSDILGGTGSCTGKVKRLKLFRFRFRLRGYDFGFWFGFGPRPALFCIAD